MSGLVAKRLFAIIPPMMPIAEKHQIFEALWKRFAPRSKKYLYVGADNSAEGICQLVDDYFSEQRVLHQIPSSLVARFNWLTENDVKVKQQLLNHFMDAQRSLAMQTLRLHLPVLLDNVRADSAKTITHSAHAVLIGNHELAVVIKRSQKEPLFSDVEIKPFAEGCMSVIAALVVLSFCLGLLATNSH